jgi:hypothetical protein
MEKSHTMPDERQSTALDAPIQFFTAFLRLACALREKEGRRQIYLMLTQPLVMRFLMYLPASHAALLY